VLLAGAVAAPASANVGETIILRCTHAQSLAGFSQSAYNQALKELEADSEEYSNCASVIRQAQLAAALRGRGGGSGPAAPSGALAATPAQQSSLARARHVRPSPIRLGGAEVQPGSVHADISSALSSIPTPLVTALAFLLACAAAVAGVLIRNRLRGGRSH
jgi:hypothetical protein